MFGVLSQGSDTSVSGDIPGGSLRIGGDGSLELSGAQGILLGLQPPTSTSLYVGTDGIVKINVLPLTVDYSGNPLITSHPIELDLIR